MIRTEDSLFSPSHGATAPTAIRSEELVADWRVILAGTAAIAALSAVCLPWPLAALSKLLGALMVAGADVDARCYLLPDLVALGGVLLGTVAAAVMDPFSPWLAIAGAVTCAAVTAAVLGAVREVHRRLRGIEGLGLGDVKLAGAIGAWPPAELIGFCFAVATGAALAFVLVSRLGGQTLVSTTRIPFGAFLCPALWLVFFLSLL